MIIRKPYAFLIKNFKKIHIVLLILSLYLAYKIVDVNGFVNEFMKLGTYDLYSDPVTNHISFIMNLAIILVIIGSGSLLFLLRYKGKPWKIYLVPLINNVVLLFILGVIKGFFRTYSIDVDTADLRFSRDLLLIFIITQIPVIVIFAMRTFGFDIGKFNFNTDEEFLELSEADREEIEISIDVDVNTFKRLYRKLIRNVNYFYQEHKLICKVIGGVIVFVFLFSSFKFIFVTNKTYKEGDNYKYNGLNIKIEKVYVSDKDYKGKIISKNSKFVIVKFNVKNLTDSVKKLNTSNFHLKAGDRDYVTTESTYSEEFYDMGSTFSKVKEINANENLGFIIVYKVEKKISNGRFVLFYQEKGNDNILRKIKLSTEDLSKIKKEKTYKLGDSFETNVIKSNDTISIDNYQLVDSFDYTARKCSIGQCLVSTYHYDSSEEYKIIILDFATNEWESKELVDYLGKSGKIIYVNSNGDTKTVPVEFALKTSYLGKIAYIKVPKNVETSKNVLLNIVIRNKEINYKLV